MRALAIVLVLATHSWYLWPSNLFNGGFEGVDVFFVLSGFLITSLLIEEHDRTGAVSLRAFYARRALRLFPALYVMLAVAFVASRLIHSVSVSYPLGGELDGIGETVGYVYNWRFVVTPTLGAWGIAQVWSLGIEEQFYLVWPLLLVVLLRRRPAWVGAVTLAIAVLSFAEGAIIWLVTQNRDDVYYPTTAGLVGLMAGAYLAWTLHRGARFGRWITPAALVALAFFAWMLFFSAVTDGWVYLWGKAALAIAAGVLILACLEPRRPLTRVFSATPLRYLGRISYSLYLWHYLVISAVLALAAGWSVPVKLALAYSVTLALSGLSHHFIEQPFVRLAHRTRVSGTTTGAVAPQPYHSDELPVSPGT